MFNFFKKKINSEISEKKIGIDIKYSELISLIVGLGENYEQKFKVATNLLDENNFAVIIDFSGMYNSTVADCDTFLIKDSPNKLLIEWKRHSQSLLPFLPSILPEKVKHSFSIDKNQSAENMFKSILSEIINYIGKEYEFADLHYDEVLESGNSKYISLE